MDKEIYKNELRARVDKKRLYWTYTFPASLNFIRHMKENHIIHDFRQIWKKIGNGGIDNIFDIFDKSSFHNPYQYANFKMTSEGRVLHNDIMFYYKLNNKLEKSLVRYYKFNGLL